MGKRGGKRKNVENADTVKKKVKKEQLWRDHKEIHQNSYFRKYYEIQFQPYFNGDQKQFELFWEYMKIKLPVVFRINPNQPNYSSFREKLFNQQFMALQIKQQKIQGEFQPQEIPKIEEIKWYPNNLVYTMNTNKQILKKSQMLSAFHTYLQKATDSGLVTRQELVSMLPPLYLDVKPDDLILDMCAAPGSKTSQLLQMLYNQQRTLIKGCVIANDVEYSRAKMLIHQVQRAGTSGMAVINHDAQFLPQLYTLRHGSIKQKFLFDKILCDVPCSGDGATRKLPNKWSNWHSNDGMVLHPLQLNLLIKGINMLKPGGLLVYSTCSINPIQDQAVVLQLMRRVQFGLKIVDIHKKYGVKGRRGLINWKVCASKGTQHKMTELKSNEGQLFHIYKNYQQAKGNYRVKPTMFPESYEVMINYGIHNTMRLLPHDQNSGGFFVALFQKQKQFSWKYQQKKVKVQTIQQQQNQINQMMQKVEQNIGREEQQIIQKKQGEIQQEQAQEAQQIVNQIKQIKQKVQQQTIIPAKIEKQKKSGRFNKQKPKKPDEYQRINEQQFEFIKTFYGIQDENFKNVLYVRKAQDFRKKVTLVSQGISKFLFADSCHKVKLINMGCKVFEKGKQSFSGNQCLYRLCQDAIHFILPVITKRKIQISLNLFKQLITKVNIKHTQIQDEQQRKRIGEITQGSFAVYIEENILGKVIIDALAAQNFKFSMNVMISKEELESLKIRYL